MIFFTIFEIFKKLIIFLKKKKKKNLCKNSTSLLTNIQLFISILYVYIIMIFTSLDGGLVNEYVDFPSIAKRISDSLTSLWPACSEKANASCKTSEAYPFILFICFFFFFFFFCCCCFLKDIYIIYNIII